MDHATNVKTFKFVRFPEKDGKPLPMVYYRGRLGKTQWLYPVGTMFGEVLITTGKDGYGRCCELRTRVREIAGWRPNVHRPFETAHDLLDAIEKLFPDWQSKPDLKALHDHLAAPPNGAKRRYSDRHHRDRMAFDATAVEDVLPTIQPEYVNVLLSQPFMSVAKSWKEAQGDSPAAATLARPTINRPIESL